MGFEDRGEREPRGGFGYHGEGHAGGFEYLEWVPRRGSWRGGFEFLGECIGEEGLSSKERASERRFHAYDMEVQI